MAEGVIESAAQSESVEDRRFSGVAVGTVINNNDCTGLGRVQVSLPWLPETKPWARVAVPMAGLGRGTFFIPQIGDEVLVAFNQGDDREVYIVGSLWNQQDRPPTRPSTDPVNNDAVNKRLIRTPLGHELEFDDARDSITIKSTKEHKISIGREKIILETAGGLAKVSLEKHGKISIDAADSILLKAEEIKLEGNRVLIQAGGTVQVQGGSTCDIQAGMVKINS